MELGVSGLASGFDWQSFVEQISDVERAPQRRLAAEQIDLGDRKIAYGSLVTQLNVLKTRVDALKDASLFGTKTATVGNTAVATATASADAAQGTHTFDIERLATAASQRGADNVGSALHATDTVDDLILDTANFASSVSTGTFTVNGSQITIAEGDSLQDVFDNISAATGVTGSYSAATDRITLSSGSEIVLGSVTDTSNFLQVAKLYNNGSGSVSSVDNLGAVQQSGTLFSANFASPITDGGSGAGAFKINGVEISFEAAADSVSDVIRRINESAAGVTASYDAVADRFVLNNQTTGDVGIALEDVTGNFLSVTGLTGGELQRGGNLEYRVNGGGLLYSTSNSITDASSGVSGVTLTALAVGEATVTIADDTEVMKTAITDFVTEYNATQAIIDAQTASTTDADGKVTAGTLAGESEAIELSTKLRGLVMGVVAGGGSVITRLEALGIESNGNDDNLRIADQAKMDEALAANLGDVRDLFSNATDGLANSLSDYINLNTAESLTVQLGGQEVLRQGALLELQDNLTRQSADIDTQIVDMERLVEANENRLILSFIAMEEAQARINQQLQFLAGQFGGGGGGGGG